MNAYRVPPSQKSKLRMLRLRHLSIFLDNSFLRYWLILYHDNYMDNWIVCHTTNQSMINIIVISAFTRHQNGSELASAWMSSATWSLDLLQIFGCWASLLLEMLLLLPFIVTIFSVVNFGSGFAQWIESEMREQEIDTWRNYIRRSK